MSTTAANSLTTRGLIAAIALGIIGALIIYIVPGFIGLLADHAKLDDEHLGYVAAWDINSMAATIGISAFLIGRVHWRWLAALGLGLICAGNVWTSHVHAFIPIVAARILSGAGAGFAVGVSFAALGRAANPDRAFAIYLVAGSIVGAGALALLPIIEAWTGPGDIFLGIALVAAAVAGGVHWLPSGAMVGAATDAGRSTVDKRLAAAALVGVFIYFMAQGAMWSYFERIGHASGIDAEVISRALAISTLAGIGGASLAGLLPARLGRAWPVALSGIGSVTSFWMLMGQVTAPILIASGVLLTFAWNLAQPLLSGLCSDADRQGRVVCAMGCIQTIGFGLGPAVAAWLLNGHDFSQIIWVSTALLVASLVVLLQGMSAHRRMAS